MKPYVVSPDAADELTSIWLYLEHEYGEEFADKTMRRLVRAFADLAETPGMGRLRPEWTTLPVHFFLVDPYFILYFRDREPLEVYAVLHTARDIPAVLRYRVN
jgi:plasmid stabilization system protein ParE